ncbi:iron complex outermembrane receptor protein [Flavobacterium aquaticum]|uniref:Iron complex outermembrane receptor protein n=1 Tax=Flavobacterium aquaticum TaxID=1236486 RepID=A0A327YV56_9FLAO|nr:TonB-dependent receptor [Flavobacterium aquaticum]RAK24532.1 iron complex outermembrane receptor protein [Flavobacterium aquaticum]
MKNKYFLSVLLFGSILGNAQETELKTDSLKEVVVTSSRIDLPFKENSRTIQIVTAEDIKKLGVTNVADALQQVAGIDVRRQGVNGMQADLYIRGGSFDQTLLLIDGIKVDDPQTGHHTMNLALPIEVIKRIEVIKGPAARVFGQNAFTGAVNIVTKDVEENSLIAKVQGGSFGQFIAEATGAVSLKESSHILHFSKNFSEGYRHNTDFDNTNYVLKSQFNKNKLPIELLTTYSERKFGANGFYGIPSAKEQYEETQASLVGLSTVIKKGNLTWKPRVYWRRNQDEYHYIRSNPSAYRNLHITNKLAAELNGSYESKAGITGFGIEMAKYYISSNRLGDNSREMASVFLEHRFQFLDKKFDITPGVAVSYFSDFDSKAFPGLDLGYQISSDFRVYGNIGYTYRVPTYTDFYYIGPQAIGNENLQPEEAISEEIGVKWLTKKFDFTFAAFNRDSNDLIDYVRLTESDVVYTPQNIQDVNTKGFETQVEYRFTLNSLPQKIKMGYTFIEDDVKQTSAAYSRYSINSMKHQFVGNYAMEWFKNFSNSIGYRYVERTSGISYNIWDVSASYKLKELEFSIYANNIFNTEYVEAGMVPMPKGNILFGVKYLFK